MTGSPSAPPPSPEPAAPSRRLVALAGVALVLAVVAAYSNSLSGPFIFDDKDSITNNPTLRHLWPPAAVLVPPGAGITVSGRPLLNLTLALNFAAGGLDVRGYHAVNLLIHVLACLALFGLVRRTLMLPALRARFGAAALPCAFATAALWALHPLQTEAVTYTVQRAESLMGLFYLLTLYCFIRAVETTAGPTTTDRETSSDGGVAHSGRRSRGRPGWYALSVLACVLGMGTKEVMVSAPVLVLLLDRGVAAGSLAEAWRRRRGYYAALAATWILVAALVLSTGGNRGGSAGFGVAVGWWDYALTQFYALVWYLRLAVWPAPLVFDYGTFWIQGFGYVWPQACLVAALVAAALYALWRRPVAGIPGAWYWAVLAPTSLVPGVTQRIVEHRMYLALAPLAVLLVAAVHRRGGRRALAALLAVAAALGVLAHRRNADYRTEVALWEDTVAKRPLNQGAHANLGAALADAGRWREAIREDETALRLGPNPVATRNNLGSALVSSGQVAEGIRQLEESLRLEPDNAQAHLNLGVALDIQKRTAEAIPHYEAALRRQPDFAAAHLNLGDALSRTGRNAEGVAHLREALRLDPASVAAHYNLAAALVRAGRLSEGQAEFEAGLRLGPADAEAYANWAGVLLATGHPVEAAAEYEAAIRLQPASAVYHFDLGNTLAAADRFEDAARQFAAALHLQPAYAEAEDNLGNALMLLRRESEAIPHFEASLRLKPDHAPAHNNLGLALARLGRLPEAAAQFAEAVRLAPSYQEARDNLARAQAQLQAP